MHEQILLQRKYRCQRLVSTWFESANQCPITLKKWDSLAFDGFDSDTFIYYLKSLLKVFKTKKKIVLVLDNASSYNSHMVKEFIAKHQKRLELLYLPSYSPDLNSIIRAWKHLRSSNALCLF